MTFNFQSRSPVLQARNQGNRSPQLATDFPLVGCPSKSHNLPGTSGYSVCSQLYCPILNILLSLHLTIPPNVAIDWLESYLHGTGCIALDALAGDTPRRPGWSYFIGIVRYHIYYEWPCRWLWWWWWCVIHCTFYKYFVEGRNVMQNVRQVTICCFSSSHETQIYPLAITLRMLSVTPWGGLLACTITYPPRSRSLLCSNALLSRFADSRWFAGYGITIVLFTFPPPGNLATSFPGIELAAWCWIVIPNSSVLLVVAYRNPLVTDWMYCSSAYFRMSESKQTSESQHDVDVASWSWIVTLR